VCNVAAGGIVRRATNPSAGGCRGGSENVVVKTGPPSSPS
jgi:hypothetical protein